MSNEVTRSHPLILPDNPDLAAFRLTRNEAGYVHTPWFGYDEQEMHGSSGEQYRYARIRRAATEAFAAILGIDAFDVTISEKPREDGSLERLFRLGTRSPCELPKPKMIEQKQDLGLSEGAIDV